MKIIVTEKISDKGVALLQAVPDFDVDVRFDIEREELLKIIPEYDAIVVRSVTKINEEFYKQVPGVTPHLPKKNFPPLSTWHRSNEFHQLSASPLLRYISS